MQGHASFRIITEWDIVSTTQLGRNFAKEIGFGVVDQARITTAISELARNIYLYAGVGEVSIQEIVERNRKGIIIVAMDNGPGIADICQVLKDGYSTSGGLGAGLPGVKRLMDDFSIDSKEGQGTTIKIIKWLR